MNKIVFVLISRVMTSVNTHTDMNTSLNTQKFFVSKLSHKKKDGDSETMVESSTATRFLLWVGYLLKNMVVVAFQITCLLVSLIDNRVLVGKLR